ncbi:MAG: hypothetical protein J6T70_07935 [Bacteroidales bacterium]|nr:hypothetical protein [Bacteroidales bacterium]
MKRFLILFLLFVAYGEVCLSQDIIITRDGQKIEANIVEIDDTQIKYKKTSNPDGPAFVLKNEKIQSIIYKNGELQMFDSKANDNAKDETNQEIDINSFVVDNSPSNQENYIVIYNFTREPFEFSLFGIEEQSAEPRLLTKAKVGIKMNQKIIVSTSGEALKKYEKFKFRTDYQFNHYHKFYINQTGHNMVLKLYDHEKQVRNELLDIKVIDAKNVQLSLLDNSSKFFNPWVKIYSATGFEWDFASMKKANKELGDPNFKITSAAKNIMLSDDKEDARSFFKFLQLCGGDAIIEYNLILNGNSKLKDVRYEVILQEDIENLIEQFTSVGGKIK